ncbi:steroid-binding protein [Clostridium sp. PL3]|uniref:Steroid-binding protein n=1 Tax=Clostridium thailandense TaxID=2794346 RepID=A0A949TT27_9CLOT|nr:cytochrome b5 domain-containing protein [Clostridium thailandense]MBV7271366.1 steroid-binding protein [Clostridium thailandense]
MNNKCDLSQELYRIQIKIFHYRQLTIFSLCPYQRNYYLNLLLREMEVLKNIKERCTSNRESSEKQKEFTIEELAKYNGAGELPAYVAVNGVVYDVSMNTTWAGGTHFGLYAGKDLTKQFSSCHLGTPIVLSNLPKVGILKK